MQSRVNRLELLKSLSLVSPGLGRVAIAEQSGCFVFQDDFLRTYNEEVTCCIENPIPGLVGAVKADKLEQILTKLPDDELDVLLKGGEIIFKSKQRRFGLLREESVQFPFDELEHPETWHPLSADFSEAIGYVKECASKDQSKFSLTCLHLTPDYIEACDNFHMMRYNLAMPIEKPVLVRKESLKHITDLGMCEVAETASWIHFKNEQGLIFACRRWMESFPDYGPFLEQAGKKVMLPAGLREAVDNAEIFANDNVDKSTVKVTLKGDAIKIEGRGVHGWYQEIKQAKYTGDPLAFSIMPKLLSNLSTLSTSCYVADNRLMVMGDKFTYSTCLELV